MANKQTDNPHQMSFDFEDWLASPTLSPSTPKESSPSPRYGSPNVYTSACTSGSRTASR